MRPNWGRVARRSAVAGGILAIFGYILAKAFLFAHQMYSGGAYDASNERVLWQTPLTMAGLGMAMTAILELAIDSFRKPAPAKVFVEPPSNPDV